TGEPLADTEKIDPVFVIGVNGFTFDIAKFDVASHVSDPLKRY
ncbi:MAG: hypothetical protein ACI9G1_001025, partial [Pirellulaceae bacterium]